MASTGQMTTAPTPAATPRPAALGATTARERLLLALAAAWLLDGVLQFQPYMYTRNFGAQLAGAAAGNPSWLAAAMRWTGHSVEAHPVSINTAFALVQVAIGLGIAWRPLLRPALAASIGWSVAVWALGEGFGGLLSGSADPLTGAPGAVILYALLAVLLWPRPIAPLLSRGLWTVLWAGLTWLAVLPANSSSGHTQAAILGTKMGAPGWLQSLDDWAADASAGHGAALAALTAAVTALAALAVWLPRPWAVRAALVPAMALAVLFWVFGQGFGMPYMGMATDPNSGPLLILLALAFWPVRSAAPAAAAATGTAAGPRSTPATRVSGSSGTTSTEETGDPA